MTRTRWSTSPIPPIGGTCPFYPAGSVDAKVTTAAAAEEMGLWARFGRADGAPFDAEEFLRLHPQYSWQEGYLQSRPSQPWTFFEG